MYELQVFLSALRQHAPSEDGEYKFADQKNDFWAVFNGNSTAEQGQRVFSQIISMCEGPLVTPMEAEKPGTMAFRAGMKYVAAQINKAFMGRNPVEREFS